MECTGLAGRDPKFGIDGSVMLVLAYEENHSLGRGTDDARRWYEAYVDFVFGSAMGKGSWYWGAGVAMGIAKLSKS